LSGQLKPFFLVFEFAGAFGGREAFNKATLAEPSVAQDLRRARPSPKSDCPLHSHTGKNLKKQKKRPEKSFLPSLFRAH
jgi:aminoglycoside phosphotransferase